MHDLPFEDNLFDIIYSHHSIDHSLFPYRALREFKRVSKESSTWIFTIPFDDYGREESIDFDSGDEILEFVKQFKPDKTPKYYLEVSRNKAGFIEPAEAWLPKGWKNELRLII
jgi:ubiquinone/menaquinone biosynthesis C-methylase UbiE